MELIDNETLQALRIRNCRWIETPARGSDGRSLQDGVFCLGFFQDGDIGVGILPEREEILVGSLCLDLISRQSKRSAELQVSQCAPCEVPHQAVMVDELLKFCCRPISVMEHKIGFATQIDRE